MDLHHPSRPMYVVQMDTDTMILGRLAIDRTHEAAASVGRWFVMPVYAYSMQPKYWVSVALAISDDACAFSKAVRFRHPRSTR